MDLSKRLIDAVKAGVYDVVDACTLQRGIARTISGMPIRLPARFCRYYPADYESPKFDFIRRHCRPAGVALDIGAHIGLFSVLMSRLVGEQGVVHSFEPTPFTRSVLRETIRMNGCRNVIVRGEAVSKAPGTAVFHDTGDDASNANSLVRMPRSRRELSVPTVSVDSLRESVGAVQFIKIDAEGGEFDILEGASETLDCCRPFVQIEIHPVPLKSQSRSLLDMWSFFRRHSMRAFLDGVELTESQFTNIHEAVELQLIPSEIA